MKNVIPFLFCLGVLSCSNHGDFTSARNNIIGQWTVDHSVQEIRADTVYSQSEFQFEITFNSDGTGHRSTNFGPQINFDWYYQFEPEIFILIGKQTGQIFANSQAYIVEKSGSDKQIWTYVVENPNLISDQFLNTWSMTRI